VNTLEPLRVLPALVEVGMPLGTELWVAVGAEVSITDLSSDENQTITFVTPPSSNDSSVDGIINVLALTDTSVTLGFIAETGEGYAVNGTLTAKLCE
jgi:hypothetical protein